MTKLLGLISISLFLTTCCYGLDDPYLIIPILVETDELPGDNGNVFLIHSVAINDTGETLVHLRNSIFNAATDEVLVQNGEIVVREGLTGFLNAPQDAFVKGFDAISISNSGKRAQNLFVGPFPFEQDSGVYRDNDLLILESEFSTAVDLAAGTPFLEFRDTKINNSDKLLVVATVDQPTNDNEAERLIMIVDGDNQQIVAKEGDLLPGQSGPIRDIEIGHSGSAFNDNDDVMFVTDVNFVESIYINNTLIAKEGLPSPIENRTYVGIGESVDMNNHGDYVFKANLSGDFDTNSVIIKNGEIFKQEGDPGPGGFQFTSFGSVSGPIKIGNEGSVLWYGEWDDPNAATDSGLFLNDMLLVQEGVSYVNGLEVDLLHDTAGKFSLSSNGEWIIFKAELDDSFGFLLNGAFAIHLSSSISGDINCDGAVDLLDVQPFVDLLSGGVFSGKADINGDGKLNLLDVGPFVELLNGG